MQKEQFRCYMTQLEISTMEIVKILWQADPLLGNDSETTRQRPVKCKKNGVFCAVRAVAVVKYTTVQVTKLPLWHKVH
jgi:hypothetical protein